MAARVTRVGWPKRETPLGCLQTQQAPPPSRHGQRRLTVS